MSLGEDRGEKPSSSPQASSDNAKTSRNDPSDLKKIVSKPAKLLLQAATVNLVHDEGGGLQKGQVAGQTAC